MNDFPQESLHCRIYRLWLNWKFRNVDQEICCCGDTVGQGGSICAHGGCRSAKEYAITCAIERRKARVAEVLRFRHNLRIAIATFDFKRDPDGCAWLPDKITISFDWDTRRITHYRNYMGWHNLSEMHRRDQCPNPAYCTWHGAL